jgi:hypothetical protein
VHKLKDFEETHQGNDNLMEIKSCSNETGGLALQNKYQGRFIWVKLKHGAIHLVFCGIDKKRGFLNVNKPEKK